MPARVPGLLRLGVFGSFARNEWAYGSDLDLVAVVRPDDSVARERRRIPFKVELLPVPADLIVYDENEWDALMSSDTRMARTLVRETSWLIGPHS
ncbi:MAG: nucleotidyltransferase domain-containing protein [Spirochaetales bacterium]|nr:nucleotidyltransferase domain-containing protein [Spirochaetales bacterium]MCP5486814.1 nucleotidyltransferase domain-containing protein [Spirochaetales bacterium]